MEVLIIGGGGREHALAWKAIQSPQVDRVYVAPGNAGTAGETAIENVDIDAEDIDALKAFAGKRRIGLTIVGPEAPLVAGIVDQFRAANLPIFGPDSAAAQLEGSKAYAKRFLLRHDIPTAHYGEFTKVEEAVAYIEANDLPIVIKADGLAAGKGVIIAETRKQAFAAVHDMLAGNTFGAAGSRVVVEEYLRGEEVSFICLVDGQHVLPLASSQDHKARDNGDEGPNTGGMGAYSPAPIVTPELHERIMHDVVKPTVAGMEKDGHPYTGFLYAGLMVDEDGVPRVLEYNCRFGDPETQPIMLRLQSDLVAHCLASLEGTLQEESAQWDPRPALGVVLAAGGYPANYAKGITIEGLDKSTADNIKVFHAGTRQQDGRIVTSGGRVLCVTALGDTVADAQRQAYAAADGVSWQDVYFRTDIGYRAVAREQVKS